jgi:hypothetical protein
MGSFPFRFFCLAAMSVEAGGGLNAGRRSEEVAMSITFPGESPEYRVARDELLGQEIGCAA